MKLNRRTIPNTKTHEGGKAVSFLNDVQKLRRSVMSCMLWEDEFYEDGQTISNRIVELAMKVPPQVVADLALEVRTKGKLRHVPLLLLEVLTKTGAKTSLVSDTIEKVIQRADEITEFVAIYWRNGKHPLSAQMKRGLARAFYKFDEYQFAKWNRNKDIKLRDVMFLVYPKPRTPEEEILFNRIANNELSTPDTWEVNLSAGADKKETFERLLSERKLGYQALLMNLRNMDQASVNHDMIKQAILAQRGASRILPFQFVSAARAVPVFEPVLNEVLINRIDNERKFIGTTIVLVDVSGSMERTLSAPKRKGQRERDHKLGITRMDAAATLGAIVQGDTVRVFTFSYDIEEVPHRLGMAGIDAINNSQHHGGTNLTEAVNWLNSNVKADRLILITDEQSHSERLPIPQFKKSYLINVASTEYGVGYGNGWVHVDGFSEAVLNYIFEMEQLALTD